MKIINQILVIFVIFTSFTTEIIKCESMRLNASFRTNIRLDKKAKKSNEGQSQSIPNTVQTGPVTQSFSDESSKIDFDALKSKDLPDMPLYWKGWIKYLKYPDNGQDKPKRFFKNTLYNNDISPADPSEDSDGGSQIPSEKHFYLVAYPEMLNFFNKRGKNKMTGIIDSLTIDFVKSIPEDHHFAGGVRDMGTFSEGSCLEVRTVRPYGFFKMTAEETYPSKGITEVWLICSDDKKAKDDLMNILIRLKLKKQHALGVYTSTTLDETLNKKGLKKKDQNGKDMFDPNYSKNINDKLESQDGHWKIIQDWTSCTIKCGGGLQYLQMICIPPKNGGKPCQGEAIRTRPCNEQPCPSIKVLQEVVQAKTTEKINPPIVKMVPVSNKPQRFEKCIIKEGDGLMLKNDKETAMLQNIPRIPVRIVMNNKTVSVYTDDSLTSLLSTFILPNTQLSRVSSDSSCFILTGGNLKNQFCQLTTERRERGNFVDEWDYDFNLFKNQCKEPRELMEDEFLQNKYKEKIQKLQGEMVAKRAVQIKEKEEKAAEMTLSRVVEKTKSMTLMAVQKELNMEAMLEKEEMEREQEEQKKLRDLIEEEKVKNEALVKNVKEKQIEDQYNLEKAEAEEEVEKIKEEAKQQILVKRAEIRKRLADMRKRNERVKASLRGEILSIRSETAKQMQNFSRAGKMDVCFNPITNPDPSGEKIEEYCQSNFGEDFAKFGDCKTLDIFCFVCCDNEFGELHVSEREQCYKNICESDKNLKKNEPFALQNIKMPQFEASDPNVVSSKLTLN